MQSYIIFDPLTGEILSTGTCVSAKLPLPPAGMAVMRGSANDAFQKIVDGKVVDKSPNELPPPRPKAPPRKILLQSEWDDLINRIDKLEG
jgi:hypothetical protein